MRRRGLRNLCFFLQLLPSNVCWLVGHDFRLDDFRLDDFRFDESADLLVLGSEALSEAASSRCHLRVATRDDV
jgi:hypothetical protein